MIIVCPLNAVSGLVESHKVSHVVSLLGPPTSMREESGARVLFYALEIGTSGFLGGSVTFRNRAVAEVKTPVLQ